MKPKPYHSLAGEKSWKAKPHPSTYPHCCLLFLESTESEGLVSPQEVRTTCPLKEGGPEKERCSRPREEKMRGGGEGYV